jgi:hypothetical protein
MATRLRRRLLPLAAMVMMVGAGGLTLGGGLAQASVTGGAGPASGITGVAPAATPSQAPATPTTAPPTTAPPTTSAPTPPAGPSSVAPSPSPSSTSPSPSPSVSGSATSGSGSFNLVYLWIALAVIAAIVVIAVISSVARGRTARRRAWQTRAADAYNRGSGLFQAVQAATQASQYRDPSAGTRWADVQARAEDLARVLQSLRAGAPGEYERARVDDAINGLDAVRSASQAGDPGAAGRLQARLREFEDAMQALRDPQ